MQNNFECIFKLVVALTFLMCVVCSHYQYSFLMFYIMFLFSFFVCLFYFLERKTAKRKKEKKKKKKRKKVESRIKFSIWKPFWSNFFFILINQGIMVSAIEASIGILKVMYKHYMDNNEDASFKDRHICIFNCKNKYQYFLKYLFDPE